MLRKQRQLRFLCPSIPLVVLLCVTGAYGSEEINEACFACHGIEGFAGEDDRPLFVDADAFAGSVHADQECAACHSDASEGPHAEELQRPNEESCSMCHPDVVEEYRQSVHGAANGNGSKDAASCQNCHGPVHAIRLSSEPGSPVYPLNLPRTCGACHGDPELGKRNGLHVLNTYDLYIDSTHGRALTHSGLVVAANCSSCHGFHGIKRHEDPASKVSRRNIPVTCGSCHAGIQEAYTEGVHGQALAAGSEKTPVCVDCHTTHEIARIDTTRWGLEVVEECGHCHGESLETYRDTLHGQVTALGFTQGARCSDCHRAHEVRHASDPKSSVAPGNLVTTCRKCHPDANENFTKYLPHANPHDRDRYPGIYYTSLFMNVLIFGVFSFFGLHTVLWFTRSSLDRRRVSLPPPEDSEED
jgi:hypothetical protein